MAEKNITIKVNQTGAKQTTKEIENLGKSTKSSMQQLRTSVKTASAELDDLGNKFRYLSLVSGVFAAGTTLAGKSFVESASKMEQSVIKLSAYSKIYTADFNDANKAAQDFASTGLVSVTEASTTLSNLLAMGLGLDKAKELMQGMLDTAVTSKENLQDTFGEALIKSSQGMRIFQERQIDAVGINTQLNRVFKEYGDTINKTTEQMSNAERYQAIYNYYTKEFANFSGAAAGAASTFGGTLNKLKNNIEQTKAALGNALIPAVGTVAEGINIATKRLREFAEAHPAISASVMLGAAALAMFVAVFATIGALVPMVVTGMGIATKAILAMASASAVLAIKASLAALIVGGLLVWILKATGKWEQWSNAIKNVADTMSKALNPIRDTGEEIEEVSDKIAKSIKNISTSISLFIRDTQQDMTEWVFSHDKKISDLRLQIEELSKSYEKSTNKIRDNYKSTMRDMSLSHTRRVEDLQREIDEEVSKGIWADQSRIRSLQRELDRENEDYALAQEEKTGTLEEQLANEEEIYDDKLIKLQKELDAELELQKKHQTEINNIRQWGLAVLDEFEKKQQAINDKGVAFLDQLEELSSEAKKTAASIGEISTSNLEVADSFNEVKDKVEKSSKSIWQYIEDWKMPILSVMSLLAVGLIAAFAKMSSAAAIGFAGATAAGSVLAGLLAKIALPVSIIVTFATVTAAISEFSKLRQEQEAASQSLAKASEMNLQAQQMWNQKYYSGEITWNELQERLKSLGASNWSNTGSSSYVPYFQKGGIVPGSSNQEVPIIAHGGETVLPSGVSPINININNPSVRSDEDIYAIAEQIKKIFSRQQVLRQFM